MTAAQTKTKWKVGGASTRGASHVRTGLPNQDACEYWLSTDGGSALLAVSDGHGSVRHFRSDIGSQLAARTAITVLRNSIESGKEFSQDTPKRLVAAWLSAAESHAQKNPFTEEELIAVETAEGVEARLSVVATPSVAYGATLLVVAAAKSGMAYLQLGDGDIIAVDGTGKTTRPLPADSRLIGNQTTSLCQAEAWNEFRMRVDSEESPTLVLVSTDGYSNSFRSEEDFLQIGNDYLHMLAERGMDGVIAELPGILEEASAKGSGDDITLGVLYLQNGTAAAPAKKDPETNAQVQHLQAEHAAQEANYRALEASHARTQRSLRILQIVVVVLVVGVLGLLSKDHFHPKVAGTPPVSVGKPDSADKKPIGKLAAEEHWVLHVDSGLEVPITSGNKLSMKDFGLLKDEPLAEVASAGGGIELKNISDAKWKVTEDGKNRDVEKNNTLRLKNNQQINFGSVKVTVLRLPAAKGIPLSGKDGTPSS